MESKFKAIRQVHRRLPLNSWQRSRSPDARKVKNVKTARHQPEMERVAHLEKRENHKTKIEKFLEILSFLFYISSPRTFKCKRVTFSVETGKHDGISVADKREC